MEASRGSRGTVSALDWGQWSSSRTPPNKRQYGPQNRSGPFADEKITLPASIRTLGHPPRCLVSILTELPRLQGNDVIQHFALGNEKHTLSFGAGLSAGIGKVSRVWEAGWPIAGNYARYVRGAVVIQWCCLLETEYKMGPQRIWSSVMWRVAFNFVVSALLANRTHRQFWHSAQRISGPEQFLVLCISTVTDSPSSYKCATHQWVGASPVLASYKLNAGKRVVTSCFAIGSVLNVATRKGFAVTRLR